MKVSFCCKDCKRKMFDYYAGILNLYIKCNRCKRVLTLKKIDEKYVADMKAITEDANASQESKDAANNALVEKAKMNDQESRVESEIRNKGYEDSLCMINENGNVKVYVKVNETLSEEDSASIKKIVEDITTLSDVDVTAMK